MTTGIPEGQLLRLSAFIAAKMGLNFPRERWRDLERGIRGAAEELGVADGGSFVEWLLSSSPTRRQVEILAGHLTVGETYFFRDKKLFKALEDSVLPELIRQRRSGGKHLRIWSAGCSSGEEPYSIAILLSKMIPDIGDWNITILATDVNTRFLQKAADGVYGNWSFRDIEEGIRERFFSRTGNGCFELVPRVREMVTFSYLNLVESTYPSLVNNTNALDIVFCRNVLMYFGREPAGEVVQNLYRCLVDGGLLIVSPSEFSNRVFSQFTTVKTSGAILYRKEISKRAGPSPCGPFQKPESGLKPGLKSIPAPAGVPSVSRPEADSEPPGLHTPKADNRNGKDLYNEAAALYDRGCYPEALEKTEKFLSQNPSNAGGLALIARIHANWGRLEKALEWCEKAVTAEKLHAGHHYLMATILQELGRTGEAVASLKKTVYLDPQFTMAYVTMGNISRKACRHKEAEKHFENALWLLNSKAPDEVLPESGGINAERLAEIIGAMRRPETGR